MKTLAAVLLGIALLGLNACGSDSSSDQAAEREGVFDPMVDAVERAESVQDIGLDRKSEIDEMIEE